MERVGFVGAGRAAGALAAALAAVDWPVVAVASRTAAAAARLAAALPAAVALPTAQTVADAADLVFLTVPDAAIAPTANSIAWRAGQAVVHTSGVESLAPLAGARRAGALVGSLHPLQTFAAAPAAEPLAPFAGITCAVEGDAALLPRLEELVRALGARPVRLPPEAKALYHAAAVTASNYVVALLHLAADLWSEFGVPEHAATTALVPLVQGAVANVAARGAAEALTGPIARGDVATVEKHLAALRLARPDALAPYCTLGQTTLALARRRGGLAPEAVQALGALLRGAETERAMAPRGESPG